MSAMRSTSADSSPPADTDPTRQSGAGHPAGTTTRRRQAALAWTVGAAAVFALLLKIAFTEGIASDAANNALQAWDMLHGHLTLHGWILADVTFYTLELPLIAVAEFFFGLSTAAVHIALAVVYLIVTICAVGIAVKDSRGASRPARAAVVVAVLAAPMLVAADQWIPIGLPDHTGTTIFLLVSALLVDHVAARVAVRGRTAAALYLLLCVLLCVILCLGQLSDTTVRYVAVPTIVVVCGYRVIAARSVRTSDAGILLAAAASVPLSLVVRAVMRHAGSYVMVAPNTKLAPVSQWAHNAALTWHAIRLLFGETAPAADPPVGAAAIFGIICMLVVAAGMLRVLYRWRTVSRAEQVLLVAIIANIGLYTVSTLAAPNSPHDIVTLLPCGAALGARAIVPGRITGRVAGRVASKATTVAVLGVVLAAALVPLAVTAAQPSARSSRFALTAWLQAHRLRYGLSGYWDSSSITVLSRNQVQVRAVIVHDGKLTLKPWDTDTAWYSPAAHDANFVIIDSNLPRPAALRVFGKPASTHQVGSWQVLIYQHNLLTQLSPAKLPPTD
jgi:hypothetical protein